MQYTAKEILPEHPVRDFLSKERPKGKVGLVLEGGAMRGVVVAGMVLALEQLGFQNRFHSLYGVSAGAVTASYFAAGQATWGTSIFYDDLLSPEFFSWKRTWRKQPPMNIDFLIKVIQERKSLDVQLALEKDLHIFASDITNGQLAHWRDFSGPEELYGSLRAATTMPFIAGGPFLYQSGQYFDGGVHTSVPWKEALQDGCTHLVVLLSRPEDSPRPSVSAIEKLLAGNIFARRYPELVPAYLRRVESYNEDLRQLRKMEEEGAPILAIAPKRGLMPISSFERKREPLLLGARQGAEAVCEKLFGESPHFYELLVSSEEKGRPLWASGAAARRRFKFW